MASQSTPDALTEMYGKRDCLVFQLKDVIPGTKTHNEWTNQLKEYSK